MIGESIAHYSITGKIGAGGMGEVYRASDSKLGREVALKILPDHLAGDAERMIRFKREAQVLASLNHPNIASIYGFEESDGKRCLVLELVEGKDLSEILGAGPLSLEESLKYARQIAEALEAAHEKGIIHRDLKPANVKITPDGAVKVLDFGLAKALEDEQAHGMVDASLSPTLTSAATRAGVVMGTAAYMSPEQAKGKAADRRSDVFSFGVVLFEMLTRSATFSGESVSDILASVLKVDPDWNRLPAGLPPRIVDLLHRCLEKDPRERLQSIGEARIALQRASASAGEAPVPAAAVTTAARGPAAAIWILLVVLAGLAGWLGGRFMTADGASEARTRKFILQPAELGVEYPFAPVLSPDGNHIAFIAAGNLWLRDLRTLVAVEVPDTYGTQAPFWSPDSQSLAFAIARRLYRVAASGGQPLALGDMPFADLDGGAWGPDDMLYLAPSAGPMYSVSARGGDPKVLFPIDQEHESDFHTPSMLPDGKSIIFTTHRSEGRDTIEVFRDGRRKVILQVPGARLEYAAFAPSGHLVFHRRSSNSGVWASEFDPDALELIGEPFVLDPDGAFPSVSRDGTLLYALGAGGGMRQLAWVDRSGKILGEIGQPQPNMTYPALSPDGKSVLVSAQEGDNAEIWLHDVERGTRTRITFGNTTAWQAAWMDGGRTILHTNGSASSNKTWRVPADGAGTAESFLDGYSVSVREDVPQLIFAYFGPGTAEDLMISDVEGSGEPQPFVQTKASESDPALSPDGKYVAYQSDESGQNEVYLKAFPGGEGKWQVSVDGGVRPRWSRAGDEIYFRQGTGLAAAFMAVDVDLKDGLRLGTPRALFTASSAPEIVFGTGYRAYDVGPDKRRFVMMKKAGEAAEHETRLVYSENWFLDYQQRKR